MSTREIVHQNRLLGIIVSASFNEPGIHFFTPNQMSQQLAYMRHPAGKVIQPHVHNAVPREVHFTQEVLVIKSGKLRVDFYTESKEYLESYVLNAGDVILLIEGGHGFEILEEVEMFEIKQGPYVGEQDKVRFTPTTHVLKTQSCGAETLKKEVVAITG
jgi:mannose-6-phosphate isomerase-like protein (cupin superfamily)